MTDKEYLEEIFNYAESLQYDPDLSHSLEVFWFRILKLQEEYKKENTHAP